VTRRTLICSAVVALGVEPLYVPGPLRRRAPDVLARLTGGAAASAAAARLSRSELDDLIAFAELLVEGRKLSLAERDLLVEQIDARTRREQEYVSLYRTTVNLLERLGGRRFSILDLSERLELMRRHRLSSPGVQPDEHLGPFPEDMRTVRTRALRDLIADYYGSPAGWAAVGYGVFPGRCGDLVRYTLSEP
jgi:hypothetical protein